MKAATKVSSSALVVESASLLFTNPFEAESAVELQDSAASSVFRMVKLGSFALHRQEIIKAFKTVGGSSTRNTPLDLKAVFGLCLDVSAVAARNGKLLFRLWFDPVTGCLEVQSAYGYRDSLPVWSAAEVDRF